MATLPFAPYRPDVAQLNSQFTADVVNVLPAQGHWLPMRTFSEIGNAPATGNNVLGAIIAKVGATWHYFCGTESRLYKFDGADWDDVSKAATTYQSDISDNRWRFRQFGNYVIAVNGTDVPQVYEIGVSTNFADLGGSPPTGARDIAVWGDHLVMFKDNTVYWSDTDDIADWSTGNSGSQAFPDGGPVYGATDSENPWIFQRYAIRRGFFMPGSPVVFSFQKVRDEIGCFAPYSICSRGDMAFFVGPGAFYMIGPEGQIPIGREKVDRTFLSQDFSVNLTGAAADLGIMGVVDPVATRVYFAICDDALEGKFNRLLIYDWALQEWSQYDDVDFLTLTDLGRATLESSGRFGNVSEPAIAVFTANKKLAPMSGTVAEAILTTAEIGATNGSVTFVDGVNPVIDATTGVYISYGTRMVRSAAVSYSAETQASTTTGRVDRRSASRFHTFKTRIAAGTVWTAAQGIDVSSMAAGRR